MQQYTIQNMRQPVMVWDNGVSLINAIRADNFISKGKLAIINPIRLWLWVVTVSNISESSGCHIESWARSGILQRNQTYNGCTNPIWMPPLFSFGEKYFGYLQGHARPVRLHKAVPMPLQPWINNLSYLSIYPTTHWSVDSSVLHWACQLWGCKS